MYSSPVPCSLVCDNPEDEPVEDLGAGEDADPGAEPQQAPDVGDEVPDRHPLVSHVLYHSIGIDSVWPCLPGTESFPK